MLKGKRRHYSQDSLILEIGTHSTKKAKEWESRGEEEIVKLKMDVECSKHLAEKFLKEYFSVLKEPKHTLLLDNAADIHPKKALIQTPHELPTAKEESAQSESEKLGELSNWRVRILISMFVVIFVSLSVLVGHSYLKYHKKQSSERARQEATRMGSKLYEAFLAQNLEALLDKLDELTAIPRMRRAFPEITSLPAVARFKRGPGSTKKANATLEFLRRVKYLFDSWSENPQEFETELRPTKKEIALFLSVWKETQALLDQLEAARQRSAESFSAMDK